MHAYNSILCLSNYWVIMEDNACTYFDEQKKIKEVARGLETGRGWQC